jgi:hypothetical protein
MRPQVDPFFRNNLDSLNFYQLTQQANAGVGYNFGSKERKQGLFLNTSYQTAKDAPQGELSRNDSRFYNGNLAYRYTLVPLDAGLSASVNLNQSESPGIRSLAIGPNLTLNKGWFEKKLRTAFGSSLSTLITNQKTTNRVLSLRLDGSYTYEKSHQFSLNSVMLRRFASASSTVSFTEFTTTFSYSYSF